MGFQAVPSLVSWPKFARWPSHLYPACCVPLLAFHGTFAKGTKICVPFQIKPLKFCSTILFDTSWWMHKMHVHMNLAKPLEKLKLWTWKWQGTYSKFLFCLPTLCFLIWTLFRQGTPSWKKRCQRSSPSIIFPSMAPYLHDLIFRACNRNNCFSNDCSGHKPVFMLQIKPPSLWVCGAV